ncbi:phage baseplate protein [Klebsiella pneumoniae]|jgi:hypothetical protein
MTMLNPSTPATIIPRRSIGPFNATVTLEEIASDDLEITQHPVQQGATITDHAYLKPATVSIKIMFNAADAPLAETYAKLRQLQASREPFDVVTGKRAYKNMLFKSLGQTNDAQTENVLSISAELQEIFIVQVETTTVPPRKQQANPGKTGATENAGQKSAQPAPERNRSALRTLAG